ncbi:hypothetical protein LK09_07480 [Microbacterium mangrovi]|uniref:DUF7882 domain-containing protein n=1 Tax=Microbacterium mangrovi TaxID=1348253 RepID=A0A0B2AAZ7_9MICO|nr:hypothetical protein [Microbacterium mangrovi]KHK98747.1 hypothetical protein LK09_07480 [Microbacterium mangrovi]
MGVLYYSAAPPVVIPDRLLAHLKIVITAKLRRDERFTLSFAPSDSDAGATSTIWLGSAIPLRFEFDGDQPEALDPLVLQQLAAEANSTRGIVLRLEPASVPALAGA